ncbi:MAG TPA: hypothetical protein DCE39_19630, partial [Planctomycetaceae bacterium]|nr:hypothetical protein [Planctomycetaceae bacterium]
MRTAEEPPGLRQTDRSVTEMPDINDVLGTLADHFGDRISTFESDCREHAADVSHHEPCPPQAVCWPLTTDEVVMAVDACRR